MSLNYQPGLLTGDSGKDTRNTVLVNQMLEIGTSRPWLTAMQECPILADLSNEKRHRLLKDLAAMKRDKVAFILDDRNRFTGGGYRNLRHVILSY